MLFPAACTADARQIGVTSLVQGNGVWRINAALTLTYPDGERATPVFCQATSSQVIKLPFTEQA